MLDTLFRRPVYSSVRFSFSAYDIGDFIYIEADLEDVTASLVEKPYASVRIYISTTSNSNCSF